MSDTLEVKVGGPKLTPDKFEETVKEFLALVRGVSKNITGITNDSDWLVEVAAGSAIIRAVPNNRAVAPVITAIKRGLRSLASGVRSAPEYFTRDEIRAARNLAKLIDPEGNFIKEVSIQNGGDPVVLTEIVSKTAEAILSGESNTAFGSCEGLIETFHHKEGQPFTCSLYDALYKRSVVCSFTNHEAEEAAYRAFRPPRRVLLSGLIHYSSEGRPVRLNANLVRIFPEENELPTVEDVQAIYNQ